ncbi:MAG: hydrogenase expression/formation C-terminal domain-containing protein [Wenzhouxiangellaceae bacterium]
MSSAIPLNIRVAEPSGTIGVGLHALAHEILSHLERLDRRGETAAIDLKSLPMAPSEFSALKNMLGQGEIDLTLDLDGPTRIRETAYPGVWWIRHEAVNGRVLSETLEITRFPEFLSVAPDQIRNAIAQLRERLQGANA